MKTQYQALAILVMAVSLIGGCNSPKRPNVAELGPPAHSPGELQSALKDYLTQRFGYFKDTRHRDNVEIVGQLPLRKHDLVSQKLTFPNLNLWAPGPGNLRDELPITDLGDIEFTYGDGTGWMQTWERNDLMYAWIVRPTPACIHGEVGYAQMRDGKAIGSTIICTVN